MEREYIKHIPHTDTLRTRIDETNPCTVCTLQRLHGNEWQVISTCEVDRLAVDIALKNSMRLQKEVEHIKSKMRRNKHAAKFVKAYTEWNAMIELGMELVHDYNKRLAYAINEMLEKVS